MHRVKSWVRALFLFFLISVIVYLLLLKVIPCGNSLYFDGLVERFSTKQSTVGQFSSIGALSRFSPYDKNSPIIFIGGMPRSGTTLMRALLDAHPDVRCGEESRVIPKIMRFSEYSKNANGVNADDAVVHTDAIDSAILAFILSIVTNHGDPAPRLCNKDPFTHRHTDYLHKLLPNSKFILMVRDGRATVHSIITRKITIKDFKIDDWRDTLRRWNKNMELMYGQCISVGADYCMPVYYEQLALHPETWMKRILNFLDLPWNNSVLHHEDFIEKPGGISLSKVERSSDQVIKPINLEALTRWIGKIPNDVVDDMDQIAPMLTVLGYDPRANSPKYGQPDPKVINSTIFVKKNKDMWEEKIEDLNIHRWD